MQSYLEVLDHILRHGRRRSNRTGVDTLGVFGAQLHVNLRPGFKLRIAPTGGGIFAFKPGDFTLDGYDPHPAIKAEVAV